MGVEPTSRPYESREITGSLPRVKTGYCEASLGLKAGASFELKAETPHRKPKKTFIHPRLERRGFLVLGQAQLEPALNANINPVYGLGVMYCYFILIFKKVNISSSGGSSLRPAAGGVVTSSGLLILFAKGEENFDEVKLFWKPNRRRAAGFTKQSTF